MATGRCLVLAQEIGPNTPCLASDLCVGLGHNTAAVISAIEGRRAIICDLALTPNHPWASWGMGRVLFHDLESLGAQIDAHKRDPQNSLLGDFTPAIDSLDPFRDGRTGERIGTYIGWLLEAFDSGLDRDSAIQQANERYSAAWGADTVVRLGADVSGPKSGQPGHLSKGRVG